MSHVGFLVYLFIFPIFCFFSTRAEPAPVTDFDDLYVI